MKSSIRNAKDFYDNIIHYENSDKVSKEIYMEFSRYKLFNGDLIFGLVGRGSTSKCNVFVEQEWADFILTRATGLIRLLNKGLILPEFIKIFLNSPTGKESSEQLIDGSTGQVVIKTSLLKRIPFPIPPLSEQKRIVERLENLLPKIDELKNEKFDLIGSSLLK